MFLSGLGFENVDDVCKLAHLCLWKSGCKFCTVQLGMSHLWGIPMSSLGWD